MRRGARCTPWTPLMARTRRLTPSICSRTCSISWARNSNARPSGGSRYTVASRITPACTSIRVRAWMPVPRRPKYTDIVYPGVVELCALSSEGRRGSPHTLEQGIQGVADPQPGRRAGRRARVGGVREVGKPVGPHRERASQRRQFTRARRSLSSDTWWNRKTPGQCDRCGIEQTKLDTHGILQARTRRPNDQIAGFTAEDFPDSRRDPDDPTSSPIRRASRRE